MISALADEECLTVDQGMDIYRRMSIFASNGYDEGESNDEPDSNLENQSCNEAQSKNVGKEETENKASGDSQQGDYDDVSVSLDDDGLETVVGISIETATNLADMNSTL